MQKQDTSSNYDLQVDLARRIFLDYDQALLIRKFHLQADPAWIYLTYLNMPCRISRTDGQILSRSDVRASLRKARHSRSKKYV